MTLGGRVAEEIVIKDISAGASGDIQAVTKRARLMVTEWGMSEKVGPISYGSDKEVFIGRDYGRTQDYSENVAAQIDEEIKKIIDDAYAKCTKLLSDNMDKLKIVAEELLEKETVDADRFEELFSGIKKEETENNIEETASKSKKFLIRKNKNIKFKRFDFTT